MKSFVSRASALWTLFLDALIPPRANEHEVRTMTSVELRRHTGTDRHAAGGAVVHTILQYQDRRVKALVQELKYHRDPRALALAAALMHEECLGIVSESLATPLLIPVPMHHTRQRERGFNQTESLCARVMREAEGSLHYRPEALVRTRATPPQQKLTRRARLTNVRNSMHGERAQVEGRVCIVVDDVTTTGATLAEARRALLSAGAAEVHLVALAG